MNRRKRRQAKARRVMALRVQQGQWIPIAVVVARAGALFRNTLVIGVR